MKKLLLIPLIVLLAGCSNRIVSSSQDSISQNTSEQVSTLSESATNEPSITSLDTTTSSSSTTSERIYEEYDWNEYTKEDIALALTEEYDVPYYKTRFYESKIAKQDSIFYVQITCHNVNLDTAKNEYTRILRLHDFKVYDDDEFTIAYRQLNKEEDQYIQFKIQEGDLVIISYKVKDRTIEWNNALVKSTIGVEVPVPKAESYQFGSSLASNGNPTFTAYCYNIEEGYMDTYAQVLEENGYQIEKVYKDIYYAENTESKIKITLYEESATTLYISMYSTNVITYWPKEEIKEILKEDLPVCSFENVKYSIRTIKVEEGYSIYTIYCDNANSIDIVTDYVQKLTSTNWTQVSKSNPSQDSSYITYTFKKNPGTQNEHMIQLIYSENYASLAIGIYY